MAKKMRPCPECGAEVAAANLERHVRRLHGTDEARKERDERRKKSLDERRRRRAGGSKKSAFLIPMLIVLLLVGGAGLVGYYQLVWLPGQQGGGGGGGGGSGDFAVFEISIDGQPQGSFKWKFRADAAPVTVKRIKELVAQGFYNGLTFHRIVPGFVVQGGDPRGDGTGGSGQTIKWEDSPLKNLAASVAMARGSDINSADSQFFINLINNPSLDKGGGSAGANQYVVFAEVVSGMDVVTKIVGVQLNGEKPVKPVAMTKVTLTTS